MNTFLSRTLFLAIAVCLSVASSSAHEPPTADLESRVSAIETSLGIGVEVAASVAEAEDIPAMLIDRQKIAEGIIEAAKQSSDLNWFEKRRIQRVMSSKRGRLNIAKERAIDYAASQMVQAELVVPTPDGVEAAADWGAILTFFQGLLPLIAQLVALFGG